MDRSPHSRVLGGRLERTSAARGRSSRSERPAGLTRRSKQLRSFAMPGPSFRPTLVISTLAGFGTAKDTDSSRIRRPAVRLTLGLVLASVIMSTDAWGQIPFSEGTALRRGFHWDFEIQTGFALAGLRRLENRFMLRGRGGVIFAREPWFWSAGATVEGFGLPDIAGGFQLGVLNLWNGLWLNGGLAVDAEPNTYAHVNGGWSIFGVEGQFQLSGQAKADQSRNAVFVIVRIPVGFIFALQPPGSSRTPLESVSTSSSAASP